jgi:hypothetical protein
MSHHGIKPVRHVFLLSFLMLVIVSASCRQSGETVDIDQRKKLAGELRDNKLHASAIEEYRKILDAGVLDDAQRGNINYLIARIYFEDLKDYRNAAAYYVRARTYHPEGSYMAEASRNLVASLEKLGQFVDASRELSAVTDIDGGPRLAGDLPVALIGDDTVWLSTVESQIQSLPAEAQKQYLTKQAREEFVRQYVGLELMYEAALREGYDRTPEIMKAKEQLFRNLLIEKFVVDKVMPEIRIDTLDVRNFYLANKEERYDGAPYDSVKAQVFLDYQAEKAGAVYTDYISRLAEAEDVTFLDHNIRD